MKEFLRDLGLSLPDLIAGFCGGVANAFVMGEKSPWAVVGSVIVGMVTANYVGASLGAYIGLSSGAGAFLTGLCAMVICQGALAAARQWRFLHAKEDK